MHACAVLRDTCYQHVSIYFNPNLVHFLQHQISRVAVKVMGFPCVQSGLFVDRASSAHGPDHADVVVVHWAFTGSGALQSLLPSVGGRCDMQSLEQSDEQLQYMCHLTSDVSHTTDCPCTSLTIRF